MALPALPAAQRAYQPTPAEQQAYAEMQARMVALLLRFNEADFVSRYGMRAGADSRPAGISPLYRDLAALALLRAELFDDILPRIIRRLSFEAPRQIIIEEPPPRGRIDWERTMDASWASLPGHPPLALHTRQRRRDFATPENLLTVAVLLEYRGLVVEVLGKNEVVAQAEALRHPLTAIVEQCERELAFPQFAGIKPEAERIVEAGEVGELVERVRERDIPGGNSAYADLIAWRERLLTLPLLQRAATQTTPSLGADPNEDNYLYQLWIFYELLDLLAEKQSIVPGSVSFKPMRVRFRREECVYELQHDQEVPKPSVSAWAEYKPSGHAVPGVRPDFYIRRVEPAVVEVRNGAAPVWREPGVIWDAKYYRETESKNAASSPIKRMIADLNLLGEPYGILLFAFLKVPESGNPNYALIPDPARSETLVPRQTVAIRQLLPALPGTRAPAQSLLETLLQDAHQRLRTPAKIACHGVFLDSLTVTAHGTFADAVAMRRRTGKPLVAADVPDEAALDTLLLCPKPHIGAWRMDVVSLEHDCCQNAQVCHIFGNGVPDIRKPSRLRRLEDIAEAIQTAGGEDETERTEAATRHVRVIAQRYADLIKPNMAELTAWVQRRLDVDPLFETFPHLTAEHRATLGLARFLWQQIENIQATNYAGPALLFTGVLEDLIKATVFARSPQLYDQYGKELYRTLGVIGRTCKDRGRNWRLMTGAVFGGNHWNVQVTGSTRIPFETWGMKVWDISRIRNQAAHEAQVSKDEFLDLERLYFGSLRDGFGALNGLLIAWREPGQA